MKPGMFPLLDNNNMQEKHFISRKQVLILREFKRVNFYEAKTSVSIRITLALKKVAFATQCGNFSFFSQILRDINVGECRSAKFAILTHLEALNFDCYEFLHFLKA